MGQRHALTELQEELQSDLRATADDLGADARRLEAIEHLKTELAVDDDRLPELARESEELVAGMAEKAETQTGLVVDAQAAGESRPGA